MLPLPAPSRWLLRGSDSQTFVSSAWAHFLCPRLPVPHLFSLLRLYFLLQLSNLSLPVSWPPSSPRCLLLFSPSFSSFFSLPSPRGSQFPPPLSCQLFPPTNSSLLPKLLTLPLKCPSFMLSLKSLLNMFSNFFPPYSYSKDRSYWISLGWGGGGRLG